MWFLRSLAIAAAGAVLTTVVQLVPQIPQIPADLVPYVAGGLAVIVNVIRKRLGIGTPKN